MLTFKILIQTSALVFCCFNVQCAWNVVAEMRLRQDLFKNKNFSTDVRPFDQTIVKMGFALSTINSLDVKKQEFSVVGWFEMAWTDHRLAWASSQYNGIKNLQVFETDIWTPKGVLVENSVKDITSLTKHSIPGRLHENGEIQWFAFDTFVVKCDVDITHYPYDTQTCGFLVTSFGYTLKELDLKPWHERVNLKYYSGNGEWEILKTWSAQYNYSDLNNNFAELRFLFMLKRKPRFYEYNYMLPVVTIGCLCVMVFKLPAESGEKLNYSLTVVLAFIMLLTLIAENVPTSSDHYSLLQAFMAEVFVLSSLTVVLSVYVLDVYYRNENVPPQGLLLNVTRMYFNFNYCFLPARIRFCFGYEPQEPQSSPSSNKPDQLADLNQESSNNNSDYDFTKESTLNVVLDRGGSTMTASSISLRMNMRPQLRRNEMNNLVRQALTEEMIRCNSSCATQAANDVPLASPRFINNRLIQWPDVSKALDDIFFNIYLLVLTVSIIVFVVSIMNPVERLL